MMISVLAAIVPIVAILLLGKAVAKLRLITNEGWLGVESIPYYVLFPALIVRTMAFADFDGLDWRLPATLIGAQLLMAVASIVLAKVLNQPGERIGVYVQSGVRWNTFIALAVAQDLLGKHGIFLIAAAAAAMVPTANLLSIVALSRFSNAKMGAAALLRQVIANPLIVSFVVGIVIYGLEIELAPSIATFLDILARAAIATGLLASGAYIQVRSGATPVSALLGWSMFRLLGLPLIAGAIAFALDMPPVAFLVVLIATAVPTASNGAILARKLGGDAILAANLIALQTLLAVASFTAILWGAAALGLT
jgi:malonate transporter